jgi:hypothetical protein
MSHNINTTAPHGDQHLRQQRRQSKDLGEIWNTQNQIGDIEKEKYDRVFHNWDNSKKCIVPLCWVCNALKNGQTVEVSLKGQTVIFQGDSEPWPQE